MSVEGRDEPLGGGGSGAEGQSPRRVPSQGGPSSCGAPSTPSGGASTPPRRPSAPPPGPSVPPQRDRGGRVGADAASSGELPPPDADLITLMRAGDDTAYEELYRRHAEAVRRYARTCCRDAHTADDLTAEVFARMLQTVRGGSGPEHAVRAYLLTTVRRVAASWTKSAKREHLVDDFAVFAAQAARSAEVSDAAASLGSFGTGLDLGADVRALHEAEQSLAMQAFRSLPERWQAVLWHTEVEDESPSDVATLFGLDANGTRVLASRAREGLKQAYLQAHVSAALASDEECARYADQLGKYARGGLRTRAERGLRKHLEECAKCRLAAGQIKELASGIPGVVPVAVIGWFGAAGYAKVVALIGGGAAGAGAAAGGSSGGAGAGAGGAAASEGIGAPVKAGIVAGVVVAAGAAVVLALAGNDATQPEPKAQPPASHHVVPPRPTPPPSKPGPKPPAPEPTAPTAPTPSRAPKPPPKPTPPPVKPEPTPAPAQPKPTPPPSKPTPPPAPVAYQWSELQYGAVGDGTKPEMRLGGSSWVWQRQGMSIDGTTYAHGVTVHGRSSVTIDLNRGCTSYDAFVGVDDMTLGLGKVRFSVFADGVPMWKSGMVKGGKRAVPVHVNLTGRKTIRLVVEPHAPFDATALADWADARFTCR